MGAAPSEQIELELELERAQRMPLDARVAPRIDLNLSSA